MGGQVTKSWMDELSEEQRAEVASNVNALSKDDKISLKKKAAGDGRFCRDDDDLAFYYYYYSSTGNSTSTVSTLTDTQITLDKTILNLAKAAGNAFSSGLDGVLKKGINLAAEVKKDIAYAATDAITQTGKVIIDISGKVADSAGNVSSSGDCKGDGAEIILGVAIIVAIFSSALFALKKAYNAVRNLVQGEKPLRSIWHLAGMSGGSYAGWLVGGFIMSTVFPGVGNLAYLAVVVLSVSLGAVLGAKFAKYTAKLSSAISVALGAYGKETIINPTNPDKYRPKPKKDSWAYKTNFPLDRLTTVLGKLKTEKDSHSECFSSIPYTDDRAKKEEFNYIIKQVRTGEASPNTTYQGKFFDIDWTQTQDSKGDYQDTLKVTPKIQVTASASGG